MLRKPTQSGLADWAFIGLLVALGIALVGNLLMTGLETYMASGKDWAVTRPVPIATEVAACFPDRFVGDKLLLPEGVNPLIVQEAILAATTRVHRQALASVPPPSPRCRGLLWRHVGHWLLVGWTPVLVFVALFLLARRRARRWNNSRSRGSPRPWPTRRFGSMRRSALRFLRESGVGATGTLSLRKSAQSARPRRPSRDDGGTSYRLDDL